MRVQLYPTSANTKTGPIPTSISSDCPPCPLKGAGCYAENWPLSLHWQRVKDAGPTWARFLHSVAGLPEGQLWRHNVAGDLPASTVQLDRIDGGKLRKLVEANQGRRGFTYTHFPARGNVRALRHANGNGFTINVSVGNIEEAREHRRRFPDLPVVCTLPIYPKAEPDVVICPNHVDKQITCWSCGLCASPDRDFIIGFPAHGSRAKMAEKSTGNRGGHRAE